MYDMKPYLKRIDEVIKKGPYKDITVSGTRLVPEEKVWNFYSLGCV